MKVSIDSRTIQPGDYFIPVKGEYFDGHDFIDEVISKGGHVLDVDLVKYATAYRKKLSCTVIGIVGSAGKTTIKDMLFSVLSQSFKCVKTHENQNNTVGVPLTLLAADADTDILIVEMGMRKPKDLTFLAKIVQPDMVVFSGVGTSHLEFFKTQRQLAKAKSEVFRKAHRWQTRNRVCFLNNKGAFPDLIQKKAIASDYRTIPYSGEDKVSENINACYTVARYLGIEDGLVEKGLNTYTPSSHRMNMVQKEGVLILDDTYNANPSGVLYALQYLRRFSGRKILVLGDMLELGKDSTLFHQDIESWAVNEEVSILFLFGEHTALITSTAIPLYHYGSLDQLNQAILNEVKEGDVVLVKGSRSMKMEKVVEFLDHALS